MSSPCGAARGRSVVPPVRRARHRRPSGGMLPLVVEDEAHRTRAGFTGDLFPVLLVRLKPSREWEPPANPAQLTARIAVGQPRRAEPGSGQGDAPLLERDDT